MPTKYEITVATLNKILIVLNEAKASLSRDALNSLEGELKAQENKEVAV